MSEPFCNGLQGIQKEDAMKHPLFALRITLYGKVTMSPST